MVSKISKFSFSLNTFLISHLFARFLCVKSGPDADRGDGEGDRRFAEGCLQHRNSAAGGAAEAPDSQGAPPSQRELQRPPATRASLLTIFLYLL